MRKEEDILLKIAELDKNRVEAIAIRDNPKSGDSERAVYANLVMIYAFQQDILEWALRGD